MSVPIYTCAEHGLHVYSADPKYVRGSGDGMNGVFRSNFVSRLVTGRIDFGKHTGPLSLKCTRRGEEMYHVGRGRYRVNPESYLILNEGQTYSSGVEDQQSIESFCIWFQAGFAERVLATVQNSPGRLLD